MKKVVISVGGSLVIPNKVDLEFLKRLKKVIKKFSRYKIVIVTGGGALARQYISSLKDKGEKIKSLVGIQTTKLNAMLVSNFLGANLLIPNSLNEIGRLLKQKNLVVCGALGYHPDMTSDGTAANIARYVKADYLINMTNVRGLYSADPRKVKNAKFISEISFKEFMKKVNKIKFKAGQHFVLDQSAARIINRHKIKTAILKDVDNLEKVLKDERFNGTTIS
ncbi:MAG: UMP kinase [Nanoarchaeota archaeon]|mgnify:CR=1 FL=1|jgi:uridylate kinase|nr:UMP kinase [Nanoarchaeota archaeon]|tara:strand:+ start:20231 stop:20896 length:666 start_codon:yes stop_codon:yes gene_type:complete